MKELAERLKKQNRTLERRLKHTEGRLQVLQDVTDRRTRHKKRLKARAVETRPGAPFCKVSDPWKVCETPLGRKILTRLVRKDALATALENYTYTAYTNHTYTIVHIYKVETNVLASMGVSKRNVVDTPSTDAGIGIALRRALENALALL